MQKNPGVCKGEKCGYPRTEEILLAAGKYCELFGHLFSVTEKEQRKKEKEKCGCIVRRVRSWVICKTCQKEKWGEWQDEYTDECTYHHARSCLDVLHL